MPFVTCCDHTLEFPKASASNACTSFLEFWKPAVEHVQDSTARVQPLTAKPAIAPWLVKTSQSLRCGKIEPCCSNLPLVFEWKELVLCSPSICFRPVKPSCRKDRQNFKLVWSGKGRKPSNCLRDCASRDRCHLTAQENVLSQRDSESIVLVCVVMPLWFCQDTPFIYFAAWTNWCFLCASGWGLFAHDGTNETAVRPTAFHGIGRLKAA